jgi:chemotaxis protein MotB
MLLDRNRRGRTTDIWPGFVDGLASLLMVVIVQLMVLVLAQYLLGEAG